MTFGGRQAVRLGMGFVFLGLLVAPGLVRGEGRAERNGRTGLVLEFVDKRYQQTHPIVLEKLKAEIRDALAARSFRVLDSATDPASKTLSAVYAVRITVTFLGFYESSGGAWSGKALMSVDLADARSSRPLADTFHTAWDKVYRSVYLYLPKRLAEWAPEVVDGAAVALADDLEKNLPVASPLPPPPPVLSASHPWTGEAAMHPHAGKTVAVLPLDSPSGSSNSVPAALRSLIETELVKTTVYNVMTLAKLKEITDLQRMGSCTEVECAVARGRVLQVELVVFGDVQQVGSTLTLNVKLAGVESASLIAAGNATCKGEDLLLREIPGVVGDLLRGVEQKERGR